MDEIIAKAQALGGAIAEHARCTEFKTALEALKADEDATRLEKEYAAAARLLAEKSSAGKPLEPEEKRNEADLRAQMSSNATIRVFLKAQADFTELMHKTNATLESAIGLE